MKMKTCVLFGVVLCSLALSGEAPKAPSETKTGDYKITFTERSPMTAELVKRLPGIKVPDYKIADESWQISVPESYKPGKSYGLLVFVSPSDGGDCPGEFKPLLEAHKLIYIGANKSGNPRAVPDRLGMALDAVANVKKLYNIDPDRVYASGFSGGGRVCSFLVPAFPETFNGVIYICGCNPLTAKTPPEQLDHMKRLNSYVFLTGDKDFNQKQTKDFFDDYNRQKFAHTTYLQVPDMGHSIPPTDWLKKGIVFLDEPLVAAATAMHKQALDLQKREKFGQALKLFSKVAARAGDSPTGKEAAEQASAIEKKRDELLASAQSLIDGGKGAEAAPILTKMLRDYEDACGNARELLVKANKK